MVSDHSYDELHVFATALGIPRRGFERDHYDIPEHLHETAISAGAVLVSSRELVTRLTAAGLRRPKSGPRARAVTDARGAARPGSSAGEEFGERLPHQPETGVPL
jgi:hypothetical protein